jgi:hypothetical protein
VFPPPSFLAAKVPRPLSSPSAMSLESGAEGEAEKAAGPKKRQKKKKEDDKGDDNKAEAAQVTWRARKTGGE